MGTILGRSRPCPYAAQEPLLKEQSNLFSDPFPSTRVSPPGLVNGGAASAACRPHTPMFPRWHLSCLTRAARAGGLGDRRRGFTRLPAPARTDALTEKFFRASRDDTNLARPPTFPVRPGYKESKKTRT